VKPKANASANVRELKAAELDRVIKAELAKKRAADDMKISRLRALRLARDAEQEQLEPGTAVPSAKPAKRKAAGSPSEN
jgi:hypothetical protein